MGLNKAHVLNAKYLKLYLFIAAFAVNFSLEAIIIINGLSIQYFFYTTPMIIQIDFLSTIEATLLWVGSFYCVYLTKEVVEETRSRRIQRFLNMALIGSFLLLFSVLLSLVSQNVEPTIKVSFDQLLARVMLVGYVVSFAGVSSALFIVLFQNKRVLRLFLIYLFSLLIPIELWSLMHWVAYPFDVVSNLGFAWQGAFLELQLFYFSYPLLLWLFIALLFSWIWMPTIKYVRDKFKLKQRIDIKAFLFDLQRRAAFSNVATRGASSNSKASSSQKSSISRLISVAVLFAFLFLGVFVAWYPYISPNPGLVGTDSLGYYYTLNAITDKDFFVAFQLATEINKARVPYHLLLYFLKCLTQLPSNVIIQLMPIGTILANALTAFWFVKIGEKKVLVAAVAAVFSLFSFNTTIAMHAGLLANWLAMASVFVMSGFVLKLQEKMSYKILSATILASASVFLIHYWTGIFFSLVLACYLFLVLWELRGHNTKFAVALIFSATAIGIALLSNILTPHLFVSYGYTENTGVIDAFALFWTRLPIFIDSWFFGAFANPVLMGLALVGIVVCFYQKTNFHRLLVSWTIVGSLLSVFVAPIGKNMNQWLMWRTLYLIPFQIPATLGLFFLAAKFESIRQNTPSFKRNSETVHFAEFSPNFPKKSTFIVILYLLIDYMASALLLTLNFPILAALVVFNYIILTLIIHFKFKGRENYSILVFIFVMLVTTLLFNYTLRSLAPLTVHRSQP